MASARRAFAWRKRLEGGGTAGFVQVKAMPAEAAAERRGGGIEVRLGGGRSLAVEPGFDADYLRALLSVLEAEA